MCRLLRAHVGVVIAITTTLFLLVSATLAFMATRPGGVAARPSPAPTTAAPDETPSQTPLSPATPTATPAATPPTIPTLTPTPSPGQAPAPACDDPAATWSVTRRLSQLIIVGGQFSDLAASTPAASAGVGAFVFFGQPAGGSGPAIRSGLAALASAAATAGQVVPWMSTDEEGGLVQRLANVAGPLPSPRQMAGRWTPSQVQSVLAAHASVMRSLGITMDLAPVLDTASPANTIADESDRSFSERADVATTYGLAFANGLRSAGVLPVVKHFPGIGHADADTDLGPATDPPLSQLEARDLIPFVGAISGGEPVIMVSHAAVPNLTGQVPASLSPATYRFLRGTLSFDGVVMTDSLGAGAVSSAGYSEASAAVQAVEAGADMVMIDAAAWSSTLAALEQAVASGALPLSGVNASVDRILTAKGLRVC